MPCISQFLPLTRTTWIGVVVLLLAASRATAADMEIRDFNITVDGKQAGQYSMTVTRQADGTVGMAGTADIRLSFLGGLKKYTYTYRGTETWSKDGRLLRLETNSNDDGKQFTVLATAEGQNLRIKVNGQERMGRPDVWVTTYWRLPPPANQRNAVIALMDADTGKDIVARLQYVDTSTINVAGQAQKMAHWRLTGGVQVELWYDGSERLVRQEWVEDGHRTVMELTRFRR